MISFEYGKELCVAVGLLVIGLVVINAFWPK